MRREKLAKLAAGTVLVLAGCRPASSPPGSLPTDTAPLIASIPAPASVPAELPPPSTPPAPEFPLADYLRALAERSPTAVEAEHKGREYRVTFRVKSFTTSGHALAWIDAAEKQLAAVKLPDEMKRGEVIPALVRFESFSAAHPSGARFGFTFLRRLEAAERSAADR